MKKTLIAMMFGAVLVLGACGGDKADKPKDDATSSVDAGEAVYNKSCVSCHGGNLEGKANAPALATIGATLSEADIKDVALNGTGGMPAILKGSEADADAVAKWLSEKK